MRCRFIILLLIVLGCGRVQARPDVDSIRVYFHHGYSTLDLSLRHNGRTLDDFIKRLHAFSSDSTRHLISFSVEGNTSPDGTSEANLRLSEQRAERVLEYIRSRVELPEQLVSVTADGIDWDALAGMVRHDESVPAREEVLDILQNTPVWVYDENHRIIDGRKKQLMEVQGGRVYRLLEKRYFAELRNCTIELCYTRDTLRETGNPDFTPPFQITEYQ